MPVPRRSGAMRSRLSRTSRVGEAELRAARACRPRARSAAARAPAARRRRARRRRGRRSAACRTLPRAARTPRRRDHRHVEQRRAERRVQKAPERVEHAGLQRGEPGEAQVREHELGQLDHESGTCSRRRGSRPAYAVAQSGAVATPSALTADSRRGHRAAEARVVALRRRRAPAARRCAANTGMNAAETAPSPSTWRRVLGIVQATKKASVSPG